MPSKEQKFEYFRVRPRNREKDRDTDSQSNSGSTVTTINKERKHRKSFTHSSSASETASHAPPSCLADNQEQLPPLSETESEYASANTSPILKTSSNVSDPASTASKPTFETPERLQPYLEESDDTMSIILAPNRVAESEEWIGPQVDSELPKAQSDDVETPKPGPVRDPIESAGEPGKSKDSKRSPEQTHASNRRTSSGSTKDRHTEAEKFSSWAGGEIGSDQYYYPAQMSNPFLPPDQNFPLITVQPQPGGEPGRPSPAPVNLTKAPSPPQPNKAQPRLRRDDSHREQRQSHPTSAMVEPPQLPEPGAARQPHLPLPAHMPDASMNPGMLIPVPPALSPVAMHHTQSNPLPYPSVPARVDHPSHILFRINNVIPDLTALMDMYHSACSLAHMREQIIADIEAQNAIKAERLNKQIDSMHRDITAMIRTSKSQEEKLKSEINGLEGKYKRLHESYVQEQRHRDHAQSAHAKLDAAFGNFKAESQKALEDQSKAFNSEKGRLIISHAAEKQDLLDRMAEAATAASENLRSVHQQHEADMKRQEEHWMQHVRDVREKSARELNEMTTALVEKERFLQEERMRHATSVEQGKNERQALSKQWDEERQSLERKTQDQLSTLSVQHGQAMGDMKGALDEAVARQLDSEQLCKDHGRKEAELRSRLDTMVSQHRQELQSTTERLYKERDDYKKTVDTSSSREIADLQAKIKALQQEKGSPVRQGDAAEPSQLREALDTITQLRKDIEVLHQSRGPSRSRQTSDSKDNTARSPKDSEQPPKGEKSRSAKLKTDDHAPSRSSTPVPKEERPERSRSHRVSGIFNTSTSSKSRGYETQSTRTEEGHRSHHRDRTC